MIFRALVIFLSVVVTYLGYQTYKLYSAKQQISVIEEAYSYGQGDLTVVEFLNYSCVYCQQAHPVISEAIEQDGNIRYIPRPVFSVDPLGSAAAYMVYAAAQQGKFEQAHKYLIENISRFDPKQIEDTHLPEFADSLGLDLEKLNRDLDGDVVKGLIARNASLFSSMGGYVTPTFYIGPSMQFIPKDQMPTSEDFVKMFDEARTIR